MRDFFVVRCLCLLVFCTLVTPARAETNPTPLGSNLFHGNFSHESAHAVLEIGDRLVLRLWNGLAFDGVLLVDETGCIELPELGSMPVVGLTQEQLEPALRSKLQASGKQETQIYVSMLDNRPVSVFVTGFVPKPGNYKGSPSDTVLAFLDRAGGIDQGRGSYRSIRLLRQGQEMTVFDLYPFVFRGELPNVRLQDGDTLVVGEKGPIVSAAGEVRNTALFEFDKDISAKKGITGAVLADMADPLPQASHVSVSGARKGSPYNLYLPLEEFRRLRLESGDKIVFLADKPGDTILVEVQGAIRGASRFPLRRNARLEEILNYISVDEHRANLKGIYIKRKSVADRQKQAIDEALRRLEQNTYTATSESPDEAQIRAKEAEMISNFVSKARNVQPDGVVVVAHDGVVADIALEDGDIIIVPEKSDVVLVSGEVMMPQAIVWSDQTALSDYVRGAGGFTNRADNGKILVVRPSGEIFTNTASIHPGDQILVLPRVESKNMQAIKDISQVLYQIAVACKMIVGM